MNNNVSIYQQIKEENRKLDAELFAHYVKSNFKTAVPKVLVNGEYIEERRQYPRVLHS